MSDLPPRQPPSVCRGGGTAGVIDPVTLGLVVVLGVVVAIAAPSSSTPGKKHFWEFWKKNPVEQVNQANAAVEAAKRAADEAVAQAKARADAAAAAAKAKADAEREKQLHVGQDAALATGAAIDAAQTATAAGKLPVRELETAKTLNKTNVEAMDQALGAAAPARVRELEVMVANLNAGVAAGTKALELMQTTLDRTVADKAAALAALDQAKKDGAAGIAAAEKDRDEKVGAAEKKRAAAEAKEQTWALERDAIARDYERLKFWGSLGVGVIVLLALFAWLHGASASRLNADLVATTEWLKSKVSPEHVQSVEEELHRDWLTAHDGTAAAVAKIKQKLRL